MTIILHLNQYRSHINIIDGKVSNLDGCVNIICWINVFIIARRNSDANMHVFL